jgi:hypothetical protein
MQSVSQCTDARRLESRAQLKTWPLVVKLARIVLGLACLEGIAFATVNNWAGQTKDHPLSILLRAAALVLTFFIAGLLFCLCSRRSITWERTPHSAWRPAFSLQAAW